MNHQDVDKAQPASPALRFNSQIDPAGSLSYAACS